MPGTNAKMNEIQALMGLQVLQHLPGIISRRQQIDALYRSRLLAIPGIHVPTLPPANVCFNHAYFPVEVDEVAFGMTRDELYTGLQRYNVFTRRYFYPLITDFACYRNVAVKDPLITARAAARRIVTLPIYDSLAVEKAERICDLIAYLCPRLRSSGATFGKDNGAPNTVQDGVQIASKAEKGNDVIASANEM